MSIHTTSNKKSNPTIIAIETSCDDTSVAVWKDGKILANITAQQHIHKIYGGVVPELASRDHEKSIAITFEAAMKKSDINPKEVDAIAFTQGPGLLGALMVGTSFAKSLAMVWKKPLIAVNHLHAHIAALYIDNPKPQFPFLCLLVSGGHTQIILVKNYFDYQIVGQTLDDAAGEAFDKIGKLDLHGTGFEPELTKWIETIKKTQQKTILVVRDYLLAAVIHHYQLQHSVIINIQQLNELE